MRDAISDDRSSPAHPRRRAANSRGRQSPKELADSELPSLLAIYKDVHTHPELSTQEKRTSEMVAKELKAVGCEVTDHIGKYDNPGLTGYGVVGLMKNGDGPVVLVRTDMDALPVEEETGLPYASKVTAKDNGGQEVHVMHACGHDVHIATFIGVARALAKLKDQWHGTIVFVGQPAEEAFGGARAMLKDGLYERFPKPDLRARVSRQRAAGDRTHRCHLRLHLRQRRFGQRDRARIGRAWRVPAPDERSDRAFGRDH